MVLGLRYIGQQPETPEGRKKVSEAVTIFTNRFAERNGSTECKELLSVDISTASNNMSEIHHRLCFTIRRNGK